MNVIRLRSVLISAAPLGILRYESQFLFANLWVIHETLRDGVEHVWPIQAYVDTGNQMPFANLRNLMEDGILR
jgi:hypothetical protein